MHHALSIDDILRLLFVYASDYDWKTPLRIERTCRHWRAMILDTPAAWYLDYLHFIPADRVGTWIGRSGDHRSISLTIPRPILTEWVSAIMPHRNRIERLRIFHHHDVLTQDFPMVTTIDFCDGGTPERSTKWMSYASYISPKLYPSLTTLNIRCDRPRSMRSLTVCASIPVTSLTLECVLLTQWSGFLIACASTVVILTLKISNRSDINPLPTICFPNLVALTIRPSHLPLHPVTPHMTFLRLRYCKQHVLSSVDLSHVTSLVLDKCIPDLTHIFPATTRILIHSGTTGIIGFLQDILESPTSLRDLSCVIIPPEYRVPDHTMQACLSRRITVQSVNDADALEDIWRSSQMPETMRKDFQAQAVDT